MMSRMIDYSLNETASRAKLAAKGAGYSWGMAEEVSRAVFWLVGRELPGPTMLLELLSSYASTDAVALAIPSIVDGQFCVKDTWLCPIASGCALSDACNVIDDSTRIVLSDVKCPILLLPFIADIAQRSDRVLVLECDNNSVSTDGNLVWLSNPDSVSLEQAASVLFRAASSTEITLTSTGFGSSRSRAVVEDHVWAALGSYSHHTYAPSTDSSRALGAGAGLNDND